MTVIIYKPSKTAMQSGNAGRESSDKRLGVGAQAEFC